MTEIQNSINTLIFITVAGVGSMLTALFAAMKWYIPKRFEQQTQEREARLEEVKMEMQTRNAADNADIERDRVLPQLVSGINNFAVSNAQMTQNLSALIQNRIEQDSRMASELHAHTLAVTGVTEGLDELRGEFSTIRKQVEQIVTDVRFNTQSSKDAKVSSDTAAAQANITLELVRTFGVKLDNIAIAAKHDTKPIAPIMPAQIDVTLHTPPSEEPLKAGNEAA